MKLEDLIRYSLQSSSSRITGAIKNNLSDLDERNVLKSSFAFTGGISRGMETLNNEVIELIRKIAKLNLTTKDVEIISSNINKFIHEQRDEILKICSELTGYSFEQVDYSRSLNIKLNETRAMVEIELGIIKKQIIDKRNQTRWDVFKMVISSIIGAVITLVVRLMIE